MANGWNWEKRYLDRWEALPDWVKLLTLPLLAPPVCAYGLAKLAVCLCLLPFLALSDWRSRRPAREITLEELRRRADQLAALLQRDLSRNPHAADVLHCGVLFSRHLARLLNRPAVRPDQARHHASRTLRHLRGWKGPGYFALRRLAADVIRWSEQREAA